MQRNKVMCDEGNAESAGEHRQNKHTSTHRHKASERERRVRDVLAQELSPAVLGGRVRCLMRQRDVKTDSYNERADGHAAAKDTQILYTHTHTKN